MSDERRKGEAEEAVAAAVAVALEAKRRGEEDAEEGKEGMSVWRSIEWLPSPWAQQMQCFPSLLPFLPFYSSPSLRPHFLSLLQICFLFFFFGLLVHSPLPFFNSVLFHNFVI